jgi:transitional endoplasmic reticulum ATPase
MTRTYNIPQHFPPLASEYEHQPNIPQESTSTGGGPQGPDSASQAFYNNSTAPRVNTDVVIAESLRKAYPQLSLTIVPTTIYCDLINYATSGLAHAERQEDSTSALGASHSWRVWVPPYRRLDGASGNVTTVVQFGKYFYRWRPGGGDKNREERNFIVYVASGRDGTSSYPQVICHYILSAPGEKDAVDELLSEVGAWMIELREEVWVFDSGFWSKSRELWQSVKNASWEDVILDEQMKKNIIADTEGFFNARETYARLKVPWKRGIIYYGPPGKYAFLIYRTIC